MTSETVSLHVWRVAPRDVPHTVVTARRAARRLRADPGIAFVKVLGTSSDAFLPTASTATRWALLTSRRATTPAAAPTAVDRRATETATLSLRPLWARGAWDGSAPFTVTDEARWDGPVVVLTRATLRARKAATFYRAVPPVAHALRTATGCRIAFGVGEAPLLRQGTVSVWDSPGAMRAFAHTATAHVAAVRATPTQRWYAEELFARFALVDARGTIDGRSLS